MDNNLSQEWQHIEWVLTDVDDTLTWDGSLPPETLQALQKLQEHNIKVVAVTGACAGWCDHIAQLWPVNAVLGENGAFLMEKQYGCLTLNSEIPLTVMREKQALLKQQISLILEDFPQLNFTLDQPYRLCEVAIDIGQNCPKVDQKIVQAVLERIHALGAHATASSIHINAWYGEHSKKVSSFNYLERQGLPKGAIYTKACYVGDSLNDQLMFEVLPLTVGVANIEHYWHQLTHFPSKVMSQPGGYGFAEFVDKLLKYKKNDQ